MFSTMWESAYSKELYQRVQYWRGRAMVYLAVVLAICWTPVLINLHARMARAARTAYAQLMPQLPVIRFENGQISTPENRPYLLTLGKPPQTVAVIDTSGQYKSLDNSDILVLLTRDKCFIRKQGGGAQVYDLTTSKAKPIVFDQALIRKLIRVAKAWLVPMGYILIYMASYLKRLIQAFFLALLGLSLTSALEVELDLGELLSLAIVSMTPAMILETAATLYGAPIPGDWILWALLTIGYFIFAINAAATKTDPA